MSITDISGDANPAGTPIITVCVTARTRCPRLGVAAVIQSVRSAASASRSSPPEADPLRLRMQPPPLTCRVRPGLRHARIADSFRMRRRTDNLIVGKQQENIEVAPQRQNIPPVRAQVERKTRPVSLMPQCRRRQPLKAFQQNTLPTTHRSRELSPLFSGHVAVANRNDEDSSNYRKTMPSQAPPSPLSTRPTRIYTNPRARRYSSTSMVTTATASGSCTEDEVRETPKAEQGKVVRKRRSTIFGSAKKPKRSSLNSTNETPGTRESPKASSVKGGVIMRLRSSTQVAFEVVKRVVGRRLSNTSALKSDQSPPVLSQDVIDTA